MAVVSEVIIGAWMLAALGISTAAVLLLDRYAPALGLLDAPCGRKEHPHAVPLVGGLAVFAAVLLASWLAGVADDASLLPLHALADHRSGFMDDVREIPPRLKFAIQIIAAAIMIWGAGLQLGSVGNLLGWRPIDLSMVAVPVTILAVVAGTAAPTGGLRLAHGQAAAVAK